MSTYTYDEVLDEVLNQVQRLTLDEQLQLLSDIAAMLRRQVESRPKHKTHGIARLLAGRHRVFRHDAIDLLY